MKLSKWFDGDIKPVLTGWYEREWSSKAARKAHDYWDGKNWFIGVGGETVARSFTKRRWRGLATDPSKRKD